jgi:hypothetical protein
VGKQLSKTLREAGASIRAAGEKYIKNIQYTLAGDIIKNGVYGNKKHILYLLVISQKI